MQTYTGPGIRAPCPGQAQCMFACAADAVSSPQAPHNRDAPTKIHTVSKVDPSFKSKRYRDKLRTEIKALEGLLPVDKSALHRKLDSQTVFRLVISYLRTKIFFKAAGLGQGADVAKLKENPENEDAPDKLDEGAERDCLRSLLDNKGLQEILEGFLLVVTSDGTILYVSHGIAQCLGFNQVDLMHRCIYGIVHPDDHYELKVVLENTLPDSKIQLSNQKNCRKHTEPDQSAPQCQRVSFLCRIKCFNGTTTGYLKMQCSGQMRSFPNTLKSNRTSSQVLFAFCRPFVSVSVDSTSDARNSGFWSKHELDLKFKQMDKKIVDVTGYDVEELEGKSLYTMIHPEDLYVFSTCHKSLIETEEIQTMYFRMQIKDGTWIWLHTRGKVVFKNSKKYSIVFSHCVVKEEDSTYIQQETASRRQHAINDLILAKSNPHMYTAYNNLNPLTDSDRFHAHALAPMHHGNCRDDGSEGSLHSPHGQCPSSWHVNADRHSPVFPSTHLPHKYSNRDRHSHAADGKKRKMENVSECGGCDVMVKRRPLDSDVNFLQPETSIAFGPCVTSDSNMLSDLTGVALNQFHNLPVECGYDPRVQYQQINSENYFQTNEFDAFMATNQMSQNHASVYDHWLANHQQDAKTVYPDPSLYRSETRVVNNAQLPCDVKHHATLPIFHDYSILPPDVAVGNAYVSSECDFYPLHDPPPYPGFNQSAVNLMAFCDSEQNDMKSEQKINFEIFSNQPCEQTSVPLIDVTSRCSVSLPVHFEISQNVSVCLSGQPPQQPSCALVGNHGYGKESISPVLSKQTDPETRHMKIVEKQANVNGHRIRRDDLPSIGSFLEFLYENA